MVGFITERDLEQAELCFPGIKGFFVALVHKPRTFLELLARFDQWIPSKRAPKPGTR